MFYSIGEMSKLTGIPATTLRYYDQEGLLPFVERKENGIRVFKDSDYEWLQVIECLKKTKMSLKDIRSFIQMSMQGDDTIQARLALIEQQRNSVEKQIADLRQTLETLDFKVWYYQTALSAGSTAIPRDMTEEELPAVFRPVRKRLRRQP